MRSSIGWSVPSLLLAVLAAAGAWWATRVPEPPALVLVDLDGGVTLTRGGGGGDLAAPGAVLAPDDHLTTGIDGRASLRLGDETTITVGPTSSLEIAAVDAAGVTLELEGGALSATVRSDSGAVRVGSRGRSVVATHAVFDVGVDGEVLQVAVSEGDVSLSGTDVTRVGAGQQVWVVDRHGEVGQIPEELLLAVEWPTEARARRESWTVEGTTAPAARVRIRGGQETVEVVADAKGAFRGTIALTEGENQVVVESTDLLGRRTEVPGVLVRDTTGPAFRAGVEYGRP